MKPSYQRQFALGFALVLSGVGLGGCASADRAVRVTDNFALYPLYDNERTWGSSYLVGPPQHHLGDEDRMQDTRAPSLDDSATDKQALPPPP